MSIPTDLTIRIRTLEDGSLFIRRLYPEAPLSEFYGEVVTATQGAQIAAALLSHLGVLGDDLPERIPPVQPQSGSRFVYLLNDGVLYKIGRSRDPELSAMKIRGERGRPVALLHAFECDDSARAERALHDRYANKRVHGEWFSLSTDEASWIRSIGGYREGAFLQVDPEAEA